MPPPEKEKFITSDSGPSGGRFTVKESVIQEAREARRAARIKQVAESPEGRSVVEGGDLASKLFPENAQRARQAIDTGTSALGGALAGGIPGAALGAGASLLAGAMNPYQAQSPVSWSNAANIVAPGVSKFAGKIPLVKSLLDRFPATMTGALDATEGAMGGAAAAVDTNQEPGMVTGTTGLSALLAGLPGAAMKKVQSSARELPAVMSPEIGKSLQSFASGGQAIQPPGSAKQLLETLTHQMSRLSPYLKTSAEEANDALNLKLALEGKTLAEGTLKKREAVLAGRKTAEATLEGDLRVDQAATKAAVKRDVNSAKDFLDAYPAERATLEQQRDAIRRSGNPQSPQNQAGLQRIDADLARLNAEKAASEKLATRTSKAAYDVQLERELADSPLLPKLRKAQASTTKASEALQRTKAEVSTYAKQAESLVSSEAQRQRALNDLVSIGIRDPRLVSDEAIKSVRSLLDDKTLSAETLFRRTIEAPKDAEAVTTGLMEFIGRDPATKQALQTRYVEHLFDTLQTGFADNVFGKTFDPKAAEKYLVTLKENKRAVNSFFENPNAYDTVYKLMERLRVSGQDLGENTMRMRISVGATGMAALVGSQIVATDNDDIGGLVLRLGGAAAAGSAAAYVLSWKSVLNKLLQSSGKDAELFKKIILADDLNRLPKDVLRSGVRAVLAEAKPLTQAEADIIKAREQGADQTPR
jgi:hypothetical protein